VAEAVPFAVVEAGELPVLPVGVDDGEVVVETPTTGAVEETLIIGVEAAETVPPKLMEVVAAVTQLLFEPLSTVKGAEGSLPPVLSRTERLNIVFACWFTNQVSSVALVCGKVTTAGPDGEAAGRTLTM
jgi:hypothetical protein